MKKRTIIALVSILLIAVICIIGNIITVAEKVSEMSPWLGYAFYAILLVLTVLYILWPTLKIIFTPELKPAGEEITPEEKKEADEIVKKTARSIFVLTSISQNGALDIFSSLSMNISMINRIVEMRGKRPSFGQLLRLYTRVAASSVLIASADEALNEVNLGELLGLSGINVTAAIFKSATNGMLNAYVALRVGMTTLRYLEEGSEAFKRNRSAIRKEVRRSAIKKLPLVVATGVKDGVFGVKNWF